MTEEVFLTPEERLAQLSDAILSTILGKTKECKLLRQSVFSQIVPKVFKDENHIIYKVMYKFRDRGIVPDEEFLRMYLLRNENAILESKGYIDIEAFSELDDNPAIAYTMAVLKKYVRLTMIPPLDEDSFALTFEKFKMEYRNVRLEELFKESETVLTDGLQIGRKFLHGADAAVSYMKVGVAEIESVIDTQAGSGFVDSSLEALNDSDEQPAVKIGDFGMVSELNEHLGGIYTPMFYSIVAPTKGGKSKFTTRLMHNIVVENGHNVVVWAQEGGKKAWWAQLRAIHYDWFYNRNEPDITKHKTGVNQDIILKGAYANEDIRSLEAASALDLFSNESYGNIVMIERPFKVETLVEELETAVKMNGAKAVLIDYLQLIEWETKGMTKSQAIGQAYQKCLAFCKRNNVALISPSQMTQEFLKEMATARDGSNKETRTVGGESSEVIRTPDINIALYGTVEDIRNGNLKVLSVPSRMCAPFPAFDIYVNFAVCQFASLK